MSKLALPHLRLSSGVVPILDASCPFVPKNVRFLVMRGANQLLHRTPVETSCCCVPANNRFARPLNTLYGFSPICETNSCGVSPPSRTAVTLVHGLLGRPCAVASQRRASSPRVAVKGHVAPAWEHSWRSAS